MRQALLAVSVDFGFPFFFFHITSSMYDGGRASGAGLRHVIAKESDTGEIGTQICHVFRRKRYRLFETILRVTSVGKFIWLAALAGAAAEVGTPQRFAPARPICKGNHASARPAERQSAPPWRDIPLPPRFLPGANP